MSRLGAHQRRASLISDQRLSAQLPVKVLDLLRPCEQAGLLGIRRIKAHTVPPDSMPCLDKYELARGQLGAPRKGLFEAGRGVATAQPVG